MLAAEIDALVKESATLDGEIEKLLADWEAIEAEIAALSNESLR